jgi:C4-dicarboxylate transporter, DctM subunit
MVLFVLMGQFVFQSGISTDIYEMANKWVGRFPGGIAMATMLACTGFAACSGSSLAGAATMGTIAFPEMEKFKYDRRFSTGCIAGGGTLSILIPPSTSMIIYGFLTETSIAKLFLAGIIPGILLSLFFLLTIYFLCKIYPQLGPIGQAFSLKEMILSLKGVIGMLLLFILVMGGLYFGLFTPSEAGAVGATGAFIISIIKRKADSHSIIASTKTALEVSCFILTITIGAMIFNTFLAVSGFTAVFSEWIVNLPLPSNLLIVLILLLYVPLGMFMDTMAMILLTIPIVFPIISAIGFDPIWFGILVTVMMETALITPPIGMNCFIVKGVTGVSLVDIFRGVLPFLGILLIFIGILFVFPKIILFLPNMIK